MEQVLEYLKLTYGPGVAVVGLILARGVYKLIPAIIDMVVEMRLLRAGLDEVKKYGPRIDKLEVDADALFEKQRFLEKKLT